MPAFLEAKLKKKYGGDSAVPYKMGIIYMSTGGV
jgi:hypothetical protein